MMRTPANLISALVSSWYPWVVLCGALLSTSDSHCALVYGLAQLALLMDINLGLADYPL